MSDTIIDKKSNSHVQLALDVRNGLNKAFVFCEGEKNIEELLKSRWMPLLAFVQKKTSEKLGFLLRNYKKEALPVYQLSDTVMSYLSDLETPPGMIVLSKRPQPVRQFDFKGPGLFLILHQLQLPQNTGALFRTAEAAGVNGVFLTQGTVDAFHPKVIRGSSGSVFRLPCIQGKTLTEITETLVEQRVSIAAADQKGEIDYSAVDWTQSTALLLGREGSGINNQDMENVQKKIYIPMLGQVESLNVGVAGAICLFEAAKQRRNFKAH